VKPLAPLVFHRRRAEIFVGGRSYYSNMCSICSSGRIAAVFDELDAAIGRFLAAPLGSLTAPELLAILERYAFLLGRLDAFRYELTSPFVRPVRRAIDGGDRLT
jgi:hypothetical protein